MEVKNDMERTMFITGNTYPMSLVRRAVRITPVTMDYYCKRLDEDKWISYWGHENTLEAAKTACGHDLRPTETRPALTLDEEGYPSLYGVQYRECLVLSPEYRPGYRPAIGKEDKSEDILSWQVLRIIWE